MLLSCCLITGAVWRRYHHVLQDRANLRISRDRAQLDLQIHLHQAQNEQNKARSTDGSPASSTRRRLPSLPPGPPSSSAGSDTQRSAAGETDAEPSNDGNRPSNNPAPSSRSSWRSEPESASSEQERAALTEMADLMDDVATVAALQELASDKETVAVPQDIVGPGTGRVVLPRWVSLERVPVGFPWAARLPAAGGATPGSPNEPIPPPGPLASPQAAAPPPRAPTAPLSYLDRRMEALPRLHCHSARPVALPPAAPPVTSARPVALPPAAPLGTPPTSPVALSTAAPPPLPANLAFPVPTAPCVSETSSRLVQLQQGICSPAQRSHCGSMPAQTNQQTQTMGTFQKGPPAALAKSGIFLQRLCPFGEDESELHSVFAQLFTPKDPSTLPKSQWLSYTRLFSIVHPYAPGRVWKHGPGNLMQLFNKWCQHQPSFAGLARSEWCKRMKESDGLQRVRAVYKFCLEYKLDNTLDR